MVGGGLARHQAMAVAARGRASTGMRQRAVVELCWGAVRCSADGMAATVAGWSAQDTRQRRSSWEYSCMGIRRNSQLFNSARFSHHWQLAGRQTRNSVAGRGLTQSSLEFRYRNSVAGRGLTQYKGRNGSGPSGPDILRRDIMNRTRKEGRSHSDKWQ